MCMLQDNSVQSTKLPVCTAVICSTLIEGFSGEWDLYISLYG